MSSKKSNPFEVDLEELTSCQQGVRVLTQGILDHVGKVSPEILEKAAHTIKMNGMIGVLITEPVYGAIGYALTLTMDMDALVAHLFEIRIRHSQHFGSSSEPIVTPPPASPSLPLSDYKGLAGYTDQLHRQYMSIMDNAMLPICIDKGDLARYRHVHESFAMLHYSLFILFDDRTPM